MLAFETYVMHYLNSTGLPPNCIVHHGAKGGPMSVRSRGHPRHFSFSGGSHGTCTKRTLFVHIVHILWWLTTNMQIKVHNVVLYRVHFGSTHRACSFVLARWCTRQFCMFIISSDRDGAQYDVVSLDVHVSLWSLHCAPLHQY